LTETPGAPSHAIDVSKSPPLTLTNVIRQSPFEIIRPGNARVEQFGEPTFVRPKMHGHSFGTEQVSGVGTGVGAGVGCPVVGGAVVVVVVVDVEVDVTTAVDVDVAVDVDAVVVVGVGVGCGVGSGVGDGVGAGVGAVAQTSVLMINESLKT